ncbi:MAG: glycosyltransferase, partial [Rhodobacteraceae bacterium]|nr:glycosyltransferase [Paracoccaceae bacterium]
GDETSWLLLRWQEGARFPLTLCRYDNNRGKGAASNTGLSLVRGRYTVLMDSDNELFEDAVEKIVDCIRTSGIDDIDELAGMYFRYVDQRDEVIGDFPNRDVRDMFRRGDGMIRAAGNEARYRLGLSFEQMPVMKSSVLREYPFIEFTDSEHSQEAITLGKIHNDHDVIHVDHVVGRYYAHDDMERLSNGDPGALNWPRANYLWSVQVLNQDMQYARHDPGFFISRARKVTRLGLHIGRPLSRQWSDLAHTKARILWLVAFLGGGLLGYFRDRLLGKSVPRADADIAKWGPAVPPQNLEIHPSHLEMPNQRVIPPH